MVCLDVIFSYRDNEDASNFGGQFCMKMAFFLRNSILIFDCLNNTCAFFHYDAIFQFSKPTSLMK